MPEALPSWFRSLSPRDLLQAVIILVAIGIAWGNVNARLVAIEGEAAERQATRKRIGEMSESIGILEERSLNQATTTNDVKAAVQRIEKYLLNGRD